MRLALVIVLTVAASVRRSRGRASGALAAARAVPGVREIENRLVSAALFEWD